MDGVFKHYVIDLSCNNNFVQVPAVQGDGNNVRGFEVELISNNVQYVVDAENTIVSIAGTKPDTKQILNECEVTEEGFILVDITSQMTVVSGRGDYSITLMDRNTNALLQSFPFYILVTKSAFNASDIISSNEFQLLTQNIVKAENATKEAIKATEDMREFEAEAKSSEEARKIAEQERELSEQKRQEDTATAIQNAEKATADTIKATNSANEATSKLNSTIQKSETATENANKATDLANEATTNATEATERIEQLEVDFSVAEKNRVQNENERIANELKRKSDNTSALNELNNATADTISATNKANAISNDLETKLASGYFNGKDGKDGVVTTVEANQLAFSVVDGDLILTYREGNTDAQNFSINEDGDLIYTLNS